MRLATIIEMIDKNNFSQAYSIKKGLLEKLTAITFYNHPSIASLDLKLNKSGTSYFKNDLEASKEKLDSLINEFEERVKGIVEKFNSEIKV